MFEKELHTYLKAAASSLPCSDAKKVFASYVYSVSRDVCSADTKDDFSAILAQLGADPHQAARHFVESQSLETIAKWHAAACRRKFLVKLAVGLTVGALAVLVAFFIATKGVLIVNTETTYTDLGNSEFTQQDLDDMAEQLTKQIAKEYRNDTNP